MTGRRTTLVGSTCRDLEDGGRLVSSVLQHPRLSADDPVLYDLEVTDGRRGYAVRGVTHDLRPHDRAGLLPRPTHGTDGTEARLVEVPPHGPCLRVTASPRSRDGIPVGTVHRLAEYGSGRPLDLPPVPA